MSRVNIRALREQGVPDSEILEMYLGARKAAAQDMTQFSKLRAKVLRRDGMRCVYCGSDGDGKALHCDHVVPRAKGGRSSLENLVAACGRCNTSKNAKDLDAWRGGK
jgi:hypothetical protein